ncbi:hypothetical protein SERLA73DRAFT_62136 [Serpula lacrymans var. lacrymans S7.3]|uniref:Major facilitator superfamily (MFS) profile domain-containing protein n=2 Tax=Serpula lacrymans var. lacrymans TaxID=341189 RepID=F8QB13_SERL3|nr:uncharacterized protein SERLADRAFT_352315 [Serpula lacrymans var. lacrymans S7.9]EGN94399.1 hypothetical protein SERLA73DRAFT_62136 [Serpula lacrymans var. lacrymans S7.3]EGO19881.1 hypothetical protein SERLADRAFT_352315 [Serpula lacrymans var. lacrymans S7.9]
MPPSSFDTLATTTSLRGAVGHNEAHELRRRCENGDIHIDRLQLEKRLLRKVDMRMSILVVLYILNFSCIPVYTKRCQNSSARLQGFQQDLHLQGQQYSTVLSILFVGYIIMQVPSNMFLNWFGRPSIHIPSCVVIWGTISILIGFYIGVLLARFFLGIVESAFFPGALFTISCWYKRDEIGLRTSILDCGSLISNGFGALAASGILSGMQGKLGHSAWRQTPGRWLFYIEGSITIFVALCAMLILPDFPHNTRWLTPEERQFAVLRLQEDVAKDSANTEETTHLSPLRGLWLALTDWKMWWFTIAATLQLLSQSFYIFFPTLSATMGFDTTISLLLCAPPWICATFIVFSISRYSDHTKRRFIFIFVTETISIIGFIISMCTMNTVARYLSLFLMIQSYAGLVVFYTWMSNTFPWSPAKRAVCLAFMNSISQLGNVCGSYVWPSTWGPSYRYSYAICVASTALFIIMCWVMSMHLTTLNKKMAKEEEERGVLTPGFRYLV